MILNSATKALLLRSQVRSLVYFCDIMDCVNSLLPHALINFSTFLPWALLSLASYSTFLRKRFFPVKLFAAAAVLLLVLAMMHGDFKLTTVDGSADSDSIHEDGPTDVCYQQSSCSNYSNETLNCTSNNMHRRLITPRGTSVLKAASLRSPCTYTWCIYLRNIFQEGWQN